MGCELGREGGASRLELEELVRATLAPRAAVAPLQQHAAVLEALPPPRARRGGARRDHAAHDVEHRLGRPAVAPPLAAVVPVDAELERAVAQLAWCMVVGSGTSSTVGVLPAALRGAWAGRKPSDRAGRQMGRGRQAGQRPTLGQLACRSPAAARSRPSRRRWPPSARRRAARRGRSAAPRASSPRRTRPTRRAGGARGRRTRRRVAARLVAEGDQFLSLQAKHSTLGRPEASSSGRRQPSSCSHGAPDCVWAAWAGRWSREADGALSSGKVDETFQNAGTPSECSSEWASSLFSTMPKIGRVWYRLIMSSIRRCGEMANFSTASSSSM